MGTSSGSAPARSEQEHREPRIAASREVKAGFPAPQIASGLPHATNVASRGENHRVASSEYLGARSLELSVLVLGAKSCTDPKLELSWVGVVGRLPDGEPLMFRGETNRRGGRGGGRGGGTERGLIFSSSRSWASPVGMMIGELVGPWLPSAVPSVAEESAASEGATSTLSGRSVGS